MASLNCSHRSEMEPSGSPIEKRVPSRCWTTPGSASSVPAKTTQPIARSGGITRDTSPSGSTASMRRPSYGPSSLWKYHHGMPFWPATTAVSSCSSGSSRGPQLAYEFALSPRNTKSTGPISVESSVAGG